MQTTSHILMIRPVGFNYNEETAVNNAFQINEQDPLVHSKAVQEFDAIVDLLRKEGVDVSVINDTPEPRTPDSIFPNNWISFHEKGDIFIYPMFAPNRRQEIRMDIIDSIKERFGISQIHYFNKSTDANEFLEGTGSMVLDRDNKIAYACRSSRTNVTLFKRWCEEAGYAPIVFQALDEHDNEIYHTNVMMCVGDRFVVICLESIKDINEREKVIAAINNSGKTIIPITPDQMNHFAGNMLQVQTKDGEKLLVMSTQAYESLTDVQKGTLGNYNRLVHSPLYTIEKNGGGSARCMMAEIHLPLR